MPRTSTAATKKASTKTQEPNYPTPFAKAPTSISPFLPQLDPAQIYITHIDRHRRDFKKQIFLFAVLVNSSVAALLLWRIYAAAPKYFALLQTLLGYASSATVDPARTTRKQQIGILLRRTVMMAFDYLLFAFIGPWPLTFFCERPANPVTWRWKVGFQAAEVVVRVSRNWAGEDLMSGIRKGRESPFFKTRIEPAIEPKFMEKTGYLMMGGSWDLDFGLMQDAHVLVKQGKVTTEDLDRLVLAHQDGTGWLAWRFEGTDSSGDVGLDLRKAMADLDGTTNGGEASPNRAMQYSSENFVESAGAIPFKISTRQICLLKTRKGQVLLAKGRRNVAEHREAAALREVKEETGYMCHLLPVTVTTRCPPAIEGPEHRNVPTTYSNVCEPFMVTHRSLQKNVMKIIWWYIAAVDETTTPTPGEDRFEAQFLNFDEALEALTFSTDQEVVRKAIEIFSVSYGRQDADRVMSQSDEKGELPDKVRTSSTLTASDALKASLDSGHGQSNAALSKKKSWFGNLRDAVQKGALQAKAAVDSLRGDPNKLEQKTETTEATQTGLQARLSHDSTLSTTTSKVSDDQEREAVASNTAKRSLRYHLQHTPSKQHNKRNSLFSVSSRSSNGKSQTLTSPGQNSPQQDDEDRHEKSSRVNSIVGSIRSLGRRKQFTSQRQPQLSGSTKVPESVPLPSSPIDIPSAAPALDLDLGPPGMLLAAFDDSPETQRVKEALRLTDPLNVTTARPKSYHVLVPDTFSTASSIGMQSTSPAQFLHLKIGPLEGSTLAIPSAPSTPMPGTNLPLELDGTSNDKSGPSHLPERTANPEDGEHQTDVPRVCSLDTMAEACAIAHAYDEEVEGWTSSSAIDSSPRKPARSSLSPLHTRQDAVSTTTLTSCPSDMVELTRQSTSTSSHNDFGLIDDWAKDDPFGTNGDLGRGLQSPGRSVTLPFRTKPGCYGGEMDLDSKDVKSVLPERVIGTSSVKETTSPSSPITPEQSLAAQLQLQRDGAWMQSLDGGDSVPTDSSSSEDVDIAGRYVFNHNTPIGHEQARDTDIIFPNYSNADSPIPHGMSSQEDLWASHLPQDRNVSPSASPTKMSNRTTYTAGLGDAEYRFHFDSWIKNTSAAYTGPEAPHTPRHRPMDASIDSISTTDDRCTAQISPMSSNPERTPTMGNRLEFDLKRSERNMRYNALCRETEQEDHLSLRSILDGSEDLDASALQAVDIDNTYTASISGVSPELKAMEPDGKIQPVANVPSDFIEPICGPARTASTPPHVAERSSTDSTALIVMEPLSPARVGGHQPGLTASLSGSARLQLRPRAASTDTLDGSLDLFGSQGSGDQENNNSGSPTKRAKASPAARYRSLSKRRSAARPLGEISRNQV